MAGRPLRFVAACLLADAAANLTGKSVFCHKFVTKKGLTQDVDNL
jgi:hypothetical protein